MASRSAAIEEEFERRRERILDDAAAYKATVGEEAENRLDQEVAAAIADQQRDWTERLDILRGRLREARDRATIAEGLVVSVLTQMCGGVDQRPQHLHSGGRGLTEIDRAAANRVLGRAGVRVRSEATASERRVLTKLDDGRVVEHTRFWLTAAPVAGVADEDEEPDPTA